MVLVVSTVELTPPSKKLLHHLALLLDLMGSARELTNPALDLTYFQFIEDLVISFPVYI